MTARPDSRVQGQATSKELALASERQLIRVGLGRRAAGVLLGWVAALLNFSRWLGWRSRPTSGTGAVLILEPYGMGDVITLEPLIRALREQNLDVRVSAKSSWRSLFPPAVVSRWLDARTPWTSYDSRSKYRWSSYWSSAFVTYLRELRHLGRGAIGIDPRGDIRSVILLHLAGCREVLSLQNYLGTDLRVSRLAARTTPAPDDMKRWQVNALFLRLLGVDPSPYGSSPRFAHFPVPVGTGAARRIGLIPVAPWEGKFWCREKWTELIECLVEAGWKVQAFAGPQQSASVVRELGGKPEVEECDSVEQWADRLASVQCLVTVDTGPMHLADALGVPVIALFGQGKLPLWAPSGSRSRVISHQNDADFVLCHPIETNAHRGREFMSRITVQEVLSAVTEALSVESAATVTRTTE